MSDFDKLIKEKVNSKQYPYSAKNWHKFTKKAGWKSAFTPAHWALTGVAVTVVAVGVYIAVRLTAAPAQAPAPTPSTQEKCTVEEVTVPTQEAEQTENAVVAVETEPQTPAATTPKEATKSTGTSARETTPETAPVTDADTLKDKPVATPTKPKRRDRITRIFVIDPDTIPTNDF